MLELVAEYHRKPHPAPGVIYDTTILLMCILSPISSDWNHIRYNLLVFVKKAVYFYKLMSYMILYLISK